MGGDLTDNKTLMAVLAFLIAVVLSFWPRRKPRQESGAMPMTEPDVSEMSKGKAVMKQGGKLASLFGDRSWTRWVVLAAAIVMLGIFSVPHSANGSELDRATGEIVSGE